MDKDFQKRITDELSIQNWQVDNTVQLLREENTIPFIARYRKEKTGNLDEEQLRSIEKLLALYDRLTERKATVLKSIEEQGKLTDELKREIENCWDPAVLEDLYLPYKPKKRTRAGIAREKGLEPLAGIIMGGKDRRDLNEIARDFLTEQVADTDAALKGAGDILAEEFSEDPSLRGWVRSFTLSNGALVSKAKDKDVSSEFEMYYDYSEKVQDMPSHRILAMNRGEQKELLKLSLDVDSAEINSGIFSRKIPKGHIFAAFLRGVSEDSCKRLIQPAIERELRNLLTERAEQKAIDVFAKNLYQLLMQPPVRNRIILGIDPAYRTGCKVAVIDRTGKYLEGTTIFPTPPREDKLTSEKVLLDLISKHAVQIIAIGNGTASRETTEFVAELIEKNRLSVQYAVVNESGASVYSASPLAREEFPELDASMRGNISIARRIQDPLAELVKIDPKSIGVGQYQHDVNQKELTSALDHTVEKAVNQVGVDVNTASESLLQHVAGMNRKLARSLRMYIRDKGALESRDSLKDVSGFGAKTFEQAAGFLKVYSSRNILDHTTIHPESYLAAKTLLKKLGLKMSFDSRSDLKYLFDSNAVNISELAGEIGVGTETLNDIIRAFIQPDRDPREDMPPILFKQGILKIEDLKEGTKVKGTIQNVTDFGAFMDIGLKNAGLIHISKLAKRFVKDPHEVVKVGDVKEATVISIDVQRQRIGLSLID